MITVYLFGLIVVCPVIYGLYWKHCRPNRSPEFRKELDVGLLVGFLVWPITIIVGTLFAIAFKIFDVVLTSEIIITKKDEDQ